MVYNTIIDTSQSSLLGISLLGNVLITRDAGTPTGDPVIVTGGTGVNAAAVSSYTVSNGATFNPGSLLGVSALTTFYIDGGTLDLGSSASLSALDNLTFTANGGKIVVETGANLNLLSAVTGFGNNSEIDFPGAAKVVASLNLLGNTVLTGENSVGGATGQTIVVSGNIYGLPALGSKTITASDGSGGILVCFLAGTQIETAEGEVPVETIRVHDQVVTVVDGARILRKVVWIGRRTIDLDAEEDDSDLVPIRIKRDAIAADVPRRDLVVTGEHCLFFDGYLVPARLLVNGRSIIKDTSLRQIEVFHIETDRHSILISDGALSESYLDTGNRRSFTSQGVRIVSPKALKTWADDAAAPLAVAEARVRSMWARLDAQATASEYAVLDKAALTTDPDLRLLCGDGRIVRSLRKDGDRFFFRLPSGAEDLTLVSRTFRPCDVLGAFIDDRRSLGVRVGEIGIWRGHVRSAYTQHLTSAVKAGWMEQEASSSRWTNGRAELFFDLASPHSLMLLEVQVVDAGPYLRGPVGSAKEAA